MVWDESIRKDQVCFTRVFCSCLAELAQRGVGDVGCGGTKVRRVIDGGAVS